jgi:hypothetical protein
LRVRPVYGVVTPRALARLACALLLACAPALPAGDAAAGQLPGRAGAPFVATPGEFRFARLNRGYREIAPEILPLEEGPLTVRLSSPRNDLIVRSHLLRLEPGAGNSYSAELRVEFMGKGWLVADVEAAGLSTRLEDEVLVPPQAVEMEGRVRLRRVRGGYEVVAEQLPRRMGVRIQSGIGRRIVNFCDRVSALPLTALDCPALEQSLTRAVVPLPPAGESFLLADADLTPQDRQQLDAYLSAALPASRRSGR